MPVTSFGGNAYDIMEATNYLYAWVSGSKKAKQAADNFSKWREDQTKPYASPEQLMRRHYFNGYNSMTDSDKEVFNKRYPEINSISTDKKDNFFRNKLFTEVFENSENPEDQKIWANRKNLTKGERDAAFAKKAIDEDIDGVSSLQESSINFLSLFDPRYATNIGISKSSDLGTTRRQAMDYLNTKGNEKYNEFYDRVLALDNASFNEMWNNFDNLSRQISNNYATYNGTDKLNISEEDKRSLLAQYIANESVGGGTFANKALAEYYQNKVAKNQSELEKIWNTGAHFIDSFVGMGIRAVGMAGAALTIGKEEGEGYWENIIDNAVTRYGDRVATTNSYSISEQEKLEAAGMSDNPILNTVDQQNSILSRNSIYELAGQYGFTTASTLLSFGSSAAVNALAKGASWTAKAAMGGKNLKSTAAGVKFLEGVVKTKKIGNVLVPGAVGTVEGGMNAAMTKQETLKGLKQNIDTKFSKAINAPYNTQEIIQSEDDIDKAIIGSGKEYSYTVAKQILGNRFDESKNYTTADIAQLLKQEYRNDLQAAEESANTGMYWDFLTNSVINGLVNTTLKASLQAPSVQNALKKFGINKDSSISDAVRFVRNGNKWTAEAKKMPKKSVIWNRVKESLGEGIEEYTQDISSSFGRGFAQDKMSQYIDNKYGDNPGTTAAENDFLQSFAAGVYAAGNTALSFDSIKAALYGALSTAIGGPNVKLKQNFQGNLAFAGITWRSAFNPLWNNKERNSINEQRDKIAEHFNSFFSDESMQNALFNAQGTSEWIAQYQEAIESNDEKSARDAKVGEMFSNIITLNSLEGTGYYDAVVANLQARANFDKANLQNSESEESKAVDQFMASAQNRTQNMSREEALQTIQKNANEMLNMMDMVEKETKSIEKIFGENIDQDVKASMVFNRVTINNYKERAQKLDEELNQVTTALNSQSDSTFSSLLSNKGKRLIAKFGSVSNAKASLPGIEKQIRNFTSIINDAEENREKLTKEDQTALAIAKAQVRALKNEHKAIKSAIADYEFNRLEKGVAQDKIEDTTVLSASEIMTLSVNDRASMLNPKHRKRYSQEQQAEIDKVNSIGTSIYQDFSKKISDRSKIENDYKYAMNAQFSLIQSPKALNAYVAKVKYQTQKRMLQKKNEILLNVNDYWRFSEKLDEVYNRGDEAEIAAVEEMLSDTESEHANSMFKKYIEETNKKKDIYDWVSKNNIFEENDPRADIFAVALDYLSNSGVDITIIEACVEALLDAPETENGEKGDLYFEQHLARVNENSPIEGQIKGYTSIEEVIQTYKDVMSRYVSELKQIRLNNEEIIISETTEDASNPPIVPDPKPESSIPELEHSSTEDDEVEGDTSVSGMIQQGKKLEEAKEESKKETEDSPKEESSDNPIITAFTENSNSEVAKIAEIALNFVANLPNFTDEVRTQVRSIIESLSSNNFNTVSEFVEAIIARANALDTKAEENETLVPDLLRQVATRIEINSNRNKNSAQSKVASPFFNKRRRTIRQQAKRQRYNLSIGGANAGMISSINIAAVKQYHPDSPLIKYYEQYGIEEFLLSGTLTKESEILFITDDSLTADVKNNMESHNAPYNENHLPIVAVVESENGPITINIDGKDKHFQPIGIMSATGVEHSAGSNNMAPIRTLAANNTGISLVKNTDGSPIITKLFKPVVAEPNYNPNSENGGNISVLDVGQNDLNESEKGTDEGYDKSKRNFLKGLHSESNNSSSTEDDEEDKHLVFTSDKLNGGTHPIYVFITPIQKTKNKKGQTVEQALHEGTIKDFNSRTRRAANALEDFLSGFDDSEMSFSRDSEGNLVPLGDTKNALDTLASTLENSISNFLYISSKLGWHYSIVPTDQIASNNKRFYNIQLVNDDDSIAPISLAMIYSGMNPIDISITQTSFLSNLIADENKNIRMRNETDSLVKWQVPYSDVEKMHEGDEAAATNISIIYDDNILEVNEANISFKYTVKGIILQKPFKSDGSPTYQTVSNADNATSSQPLNKPVIIADGQVHSEGAIIDSDSGAIIEGSENSPVNRAFERAKRVVDQIVENPKHVRLSDDNSTYVDDNGTVYARVTSIISADAESTERFDPNSPWVTPSTNIGTGIDEFVRDFFAGVSIDFSKYPNVTPEALQKFSEQLTVLKNYIEVNGLTVVPRDITVTGQIEVAGNDGKVHTINVAGTLDLLAYDAKGNFYIFDMKTHRGNIDQNKKDKWARQLSLYKELLEKSYGIQVKAMNIIPIKVSYPTPSGFGDGDASYTVSPEKANQLLIDGKDFKDANPDLGELITLLYKPLKIIYNKLTSTEKDILAKLEEVINDSIKSESNQSDSVIPIEVQVAESDKKPDNPIVGVPVDMSIGADLFNDSFSGMGGWNLDSRLTPIPFHLQWDNLTQEERDGLMAKHIDEAAWSQKEDQEMEHDLACLKE